MINACAAAADELRASRRLIGSLEAANRLLTERLETEKRSTALYSELDKMRLSETAALNAVIKAKNETISAKDAVVTEQGKLIETLKSKKSSPLKRLGDILIGAAVFAILK